MAGLVEKRRQLHALFGSYSRRIERLYDTFINKLTDLAHDAGVGVETLLKTDALFGFSNYPELQQELSRIFSDYVQKDVLAYKAGITDGVALAYTHDKALLTGFSVLSDKAISHARNIAAETFIRSRMRTAKGLSLSQLVWNYAQQSKSEFEVAVSNVISDGLRKGTSAEELGRMVREYLNNPDMMYRRYHRTVVDANGNKKDVVKWRRRVVDENGKVRFVEEPLEQVGMGHYRSSRKNANRLMRTEINGAYHRANSERWQMEPFVIGIAIELSPQHPEEDMCDFLSGENFEDPKGHYPKDFVFTGWHPQCLCMSNPITIQGEEKKEFYRRLAAGEDMSNYVSPNAVKDIPDTAKQWIDDNRDQFIRAGERGKLGYIWQDNVKYWQKQFTAEELRQMGYERIAPIKLPKTEEEKAAIRQRWQEHQLTRAQIEIKNARLLEDDSPVINTRLNALKAAIETGDYTKISSALQEVRHGITIQRDADFRHLHRDTEAIQAAWDARKAKNALIIKTGKNVWSVADNLSYYDTIQLKGSLRSAIIVNNLADVNLYSRALAKQIAQINKTAATWEEYIPSIKTHLQSLSVNELTPVYENISKKVAFIENKYAGNLLKQSDKYTWEAVDYLGGNMSGVQQKYPTTWKISQEAYFNLAQKTKEAYEWGEVEKFTAQLKAFKTKSSTIKGYISDLDILISQKENLAEAQAIVAKAEKKQMSLAAKNAKKGAVDSSVITEERKNAAVWDTQGGQLADDTLFDTASKAWLKATKTEKKYIYEYTHHFCDKNEPLQGRRYVGHQTREQFEKKVKAITKYIERNELPEDMWFMRGDSNMNVIRSRIEFAGGTFPLDPQDLVGMVMQEGGFMSTGSHKGSGFSNKDVVINIFAPKGTKAAYVEPFSAFGNGFDKDWDGLARQTYFSGEHETLFQRGTKMRITKVYQQGYTTYIDVEVIGQELKDLSYVLDNNIGY